MIGYFLALLPLYIFVYTPLSRLLSGPSLSRSSHDIVFNASFITPEEPVNCPSQNFGIHVLSREPLVLYLPSFLGPDETRHLTDVSDSLFETSTVSEGQNSKVDASVRLSEVAVPARDDVIKCIESRARELQGWRENLHLEKLKVQRYGKSGHYIHHYDWTGNPTADRVSSFMVYVSANCTGGGTEFPRLKRPVSLKWCEYIECNEGEGVTFKPIAGNAVYWENLRPDGTGYEETWHAGLPVLSGTKIGLNIWSWMVFRDP